MMVRLRSCGGWISIRQLFPPTLLKLVKAPRVRQAVIPSIFSSSVNEGKRSADNHIGHPWGGERESAKKTGLRLSPPCRGLRDQFPARVGDQVHSVTLDSVRLVDLDWGRWSWRSDARNSGRAEPSGESSFSDSIETSPTNSLFTRGHRDDQCGISSCLESYRPEPARGGPNSSRSR